MATALREFALTSDLQTLLAGLRWRIRLYIWLEGLSLALIWVGALFWIGWALDYLPVLLGASEMPLFARGVLLAFAGAMLAAILYRWIFRRTFVRLADRSLALILERRFKNFNDSLVTAVELADLPDHASAYSREMLTRTTQQARQGVDNVRYTQVFNQAGLTWKLVAAVAVAASLVIAWAANASAVERAAQRLLLINNDPWPRYARIEVVGVEVLRTPGPGEETARTLSIPFAGNVAKVARGSNVSLKVRAAQAPEAQVVPQQCTVIYRTLKGGATIQGERGSVSMSSFRDSGDWRNFWCDSKPFKGVLSTILFDVKGYDHRVSGFRLEVVESPAVIETTLDLTYPKYMVDEAAASHLPALNQPYLAAGTFIPAGTQVTVKFKANKPLKKAEIIPSDGSPPATIEIAQAASDNQTFAYRIDDLKTSVTLDVSLIDTDNVMTERPYRVFLTAVEDQPPQVEVVLKGIGSAVTPDVMIPVRGKIADDYAVGETWFHVQVNDSGEPRDVKFALAKGGAVEQQMDFREERAKKSELEIKPGDQLNLAVKAADKFDLAGEPHVATGDRWQLAVVTPEDLLAQLEVREVALRRRFEQIIEEVTQLRDSLLRAKASLASTSAADDVEELRSDDLDAKPLTPEKKAARAAELRLLRVQRALQQSQKSVAEVLGVAAGFLEIREELINNRVDTEDRKNRLKEQIADPLNKTCTEQFPQLDERLTALEATLRESGTKVAPEKAAPLSDQAIDQANLVLSELEAVLAKMQDLETYNELLEIVRDLLQDQGKVLERTQQERKRQTVEELRKLE